MPHGLGNSQCKGVRVYVEFIVKRICAEPYVIWLDSIGIKYCCAWVCYIMVNYVDMRCLHVEVGAHKVCIGLSVLAHSCASKPICSM